MADEGEIPPFLGGDDPWHWLSSEGDEQLEKLNEQQRAELMEFAVNTNKMFSSRIGRVFLERWRQNIWDMSAFYPGWTLDQANAMATWLDGQRHAIKWIDGLMKLAREN